MSLTRVTITGADGAVAPSALLAISEEFPFVEWGILFSESRSGTARYPTQGWINDFYDEFLDAVQHDWGHAAAHLCGVDARAVFGYDFSGVHAHDGVFRRFQLNGFAYGLEEKYIADRRLAGVFRAALGHPGLEFILQAPTTDALVVAKRVADSARTWPADDGIRNVSALFDPSGGRGTSPAIWPEPPGHLRVGYAGGITPDNVVATISAISAVTGEEFWIDMESGVRTNEQFDLDKVRRVLELAKPLVRAPRRSRQ